MNHKVGWHLGNARHMHSGDWSILNSVPPRMITFISGESITSDDIRNILRISSNCHIFMRPYFRPSDKEEDFRNYLEDAKLVIGSGNFDFIPKDQRHLQIFNEQNMPHTAPVGHPTDQWEGFGPSVDAMKRFNRWYCIAHDELKAVNPTWKIGFSPLTPGNRDVYFRTDPIGVPYYMHGPEAAKDNPSEEEIQAAIRSGPCYEAMKRCDEYLAHIYILNDVENQMLELWGGLRFLQYAKFFPRPLDIWLTELGIGGNVSNWSKWFTIMDTIPKVKGTGIWRLGYEIRSAGEPLVKELRRYTGGAVPDPIEVTEPKPLPPGEEQKEPGLLIGVCGRNAPMFETDDYYLAIAAKIDLIKVMSLTVPHCLGVFRDDNPNIKFIVRLYDDRMCRGHHPTPYEFAQMMIPVIERFLPFTDLFEVHNEPNHLEGIEGWGQEDYHAMGFNDWFIETYEILKEKFPTARLGFPGLAVPHNDFLWLELCNDAIVLADWLGVHCYWQNPTYTEGNHLADFWGLRFKGYHRIFPEKEIHITEFGNSNTQGGYSVDFVKIAQEYVEFYQELCKHPYVKSASGFIMSAPQPAWRGFCWRDEDGRFTPIVEAVGNMSRQSVTPEEPAMGEQEIRNFAWNMMGIPYNPDLAFPTYARKHGLGIPLTEEGDIGEYRVQGFVGGIIYCKIGEWDKISHMDW